LPVKCNHRRAAPMTGVSEISSFVLTDRHSIWRRGYYPHSGPVLVFFTTATAALEVENSDDSFMLSAWTSYVGDMVMIRDDPQLHCLV